MKNLILALALLCGVAATAQEEYILQIDGKNITISLDKEYKVDVNGKKVNVKLAAKDTVVYNDNLFSFKYLKDYKVSKTSLEEGIEQLMLFTAEGSGIIIQKFSTISPTMLNELMLGEVTKESLNYGYMLNRKDYRKKLRSGQEINICRAELSYNGEMNVYEVATIGGKDEGILIMTMVMNEELGERGKKMIDLMWNTIMYK